MKKLAILLLTTILAGALLVACATNGSDSDATTSDTEATSSSSDATTSDTEATSSDTEVTPTPIPSEASAFEGSTDEILNDLINKTIEKKVVVDEELSSIKYYHKKVNTDSCQDILGLTPVEFISDLEDAVEAKPEGSWFAHSIVLIKCKNGVDAAAMAEKISKGTNPARFGCIKAEAVVVGQAGQYILLCASFQTTSNAVYATFSELSAATSIRIDRENDWSGGGLGG